MEKIYIKTAIQGEGFYCQGAYVNNHEAVRVKKTHDISRKIADGSVIVYDVTDKKKPTKGDK